MSNQRDSLPNPWIVCQYCQETYRIDTNNHCPECLKMCKHCQFARLEHLRIGRITLCPSSTFEEEE